MLKNIFVLILCISLLSGCTKDVNLASDVDMLVKPSPGLDTIMNNKSSNAPPPTRAPIVTPPPTPTPPTPPPAVLGTSDQLATVSGIINDTVVTLNTSKGLIKIKLYSSKAPNTVTNFLTKAKNNFYTNLIFHRVEDWVIQGGDPKGNGTGGGNMPTETNPIPFKEGSVGIARGADPAISNDSQFFICIKDCNWLTGLYTNFGEVTEGMEVAKSISKGDMIGNITIVSN